MDTNMNRDGYRSRAALEREIAARSTDPSQKRIHENMARMYDALSDEDMSKNPPPKSVDGDKPSDNRQ